MKKKVLSVLLALVLVLVLSFSLVTAVPVAAATWTVDAGGGGDFTTIQEAIDGAQDLDTIIVADGIYSATIDNSILLAGEGYGYCFVHIDKPITLVGQSRDGVILDGTGLQTEVRSTGIWVSVSNVTVKNLTIQNFTSTAQPGNACYGLYVMEKFRDYTWANVAPLQYVTAENLKVVGSVCPIYFMKTEYATVKDCVVDNNLGDGIWVAWGSNHATVQGNIVTNSGDHGIWVGSSWMGQGHSSNAATIIDNNINGAREGGISFVNSAGATISGNTITNVAGEGWSVGALSLKDSCSNVAAFSNNIYGNDGAWNSYNGTGHGIGIDGTPSNINLFLNNIYDNSGDGCHNYSTVAVNAANNWWGDPSGPDGVGTGTGDEVSEYVTYQPWLSGPGAYAWIDTDLNSAFDLGESHFATIQAAVNAASPGDTISVTGGTYSEHIVITTSSLNLIGEDRETTIIDATQDSSWPVAKAGILIGEYPLADDVHGVTISGFTIRDAAMQEGDVPYEGAKYGVGPGGLAGIQIYNSSSNIIEDNILINNYWQIWLVAEWPAAGYTECRNNRIANNIIQNSENDGVYLYSDGGVYVENTEIVSNEISNAYGEFASGVEFWGWPEGGDIPTISNTVISDNLITGCTYGVRIRDDVSDITGTSVNYNNFVDNANYGIYNGVASTLDATLNWWGKKTGPYHATLNPGVVANMGDAVSDNVGFSPWLYKLQETIVPTKEPAYAQSVVLDNTGAYGWNTFSAPIYLDGSADTWAKLITLTGLDYSIAYRFDPASELPFVPLNTDDDHAITLGEGFFIKMNAPGSLPILYSTADNLLLPSRPLTVGFNLIGLASLEDMLVENALFSLAGEGQVVSPTGNESPGAVLTGRTVYVGEAYWVYMLDEETLIGFTTTPVNWEP